MSNSPILGIPLLDAAQSQPELKVNEAILIQEAIASRTAKDKDLKTPAALTPADGDVYLVGSNPTGDWSTYGFYVAVWYQTAWLFVAPRAGWIFYLDDEDRYYKYMPGSPTGWELYA